MCHRGPRHGHLHVQLLHLITLGGAGVVIHISRLVPTIGGPLKRRTRDITVSYRRRHSPGNVRLKLQFRPSADQPILDVIGERVPLRSYFRISTFQIQRRRGLRQTASMIAHQPTLSRSFFGCLSCPLFRIEAKFHLVRPRPAFHASGQNTPELTGRRSRAGHPLKICNAPASALFGTFAVNFLGR